MKKIFVPPIKCQGIKTKLVLWILKNMPRMDKGIYIEPFLGSGVVAFNVLPERAILADSNPYIIEFYQGLQKKKYTSREIRNFLRSEGEKLAREGDAYYYRVRQRFNQDHNPIDFLFLSRACFNGLIRFNGKGKHNVPFGHKPERFSKAYISKIVHQVEFVEYYLARRKWELRCADFRDTIAEADKHDFIYCDPPYVGRHVDYYDSWSDEDEPALHEALMRSRSKFMLSTWHSNKYRKNSFIETLWKDLNMATREHFYHVGASEANRNSMLEALIMNYQIPRVEKQMQETEKEARDLVLFSL